MKYELVKSFKMISSEERIIEFIDKNTETLKILEAIEPLLRKHFPNASFSIELCDNLTWTTEEKILINVPVSEESFFNSALRSFKEIYKALSISWNISSVRLCSSHIYQRDHMTGLKRTAPSI